MSSIVSSAWNWVKTTAASAVETAREYLPHALFAAGSVAALAAVTIKRAATITATAASNHPPIPMGTNIALATTSLICNAVGFYVLSKNQKQKKEAQDKKIIELTKQHASEADVVLNNTKKVLQDQITSLNETIKSQKAEIAQLSEELITRENLATGKIDELGEEIRKLNISIKDYENYLANSYLQRQSSTQANQLQTHSQPRNSLPPTIVEERLQEMGKSPEKFCDAAAASLPTAFLVETCQDYFKS